MIPVFGADHVTAMVGAFTVPPTVATVTAGVPVTAYAVASLVTEELEAVTPKSAVVPVQFAPRDFFTVHRFVTPVAWNNAIEQFPDAD